MDPGRYIISNKDQIAQIVEDFCAELHKNHSSTKEQEPIPKVLNIGSEDIPKISSGEIRSAPRGMKNKKNSVRR